MKHVFGIENELTEQEVEQVSGGKSMRPPRMVVCPPDLTTMALGEEGGDWGITTKAMGEEGGGGKATTLAIGEEGGSFV